MIKPIEGRRTAEADEDPRDPDTSLFAVGLSAASAKPVGASAESRRTTERVSSLSVEPDRSRIASRRIHMRPLYVSLVASMLAVPSAGYAQDDPTANRGVFAPGQRAAARPGQPIFTLPGRAPVAIPAQPAVAVPGPASPGQFLPSIIIPTPIPGQPGFGSAMVNGRRAIIEQGTNRIVQYLE
jgi:hypothetical protein